MSKFVVVKETAIRTMSGVKAKSKVSGKHGDRWGDWVLNLESAASLDYVNKWYRNGPY